MRYVYLVLLVLLLAAIGIFAFQNTDTVPVKVYRHSIEQPMAVVLAAVYVLGMLTGWTVVGFVKRSIRRVTQSPPPK
jgi:uncharacterized integral membrane protein